MLRNILNTHLVSPNYRFKIHEIIINDTLQPILWNSLFFFKKYYHFIRQYGCLHEPLCFNLFFILSISTSKYICLSREKTNCDSKVQFLDYSNTCMGFVFQVSVRNWANDTFVFKSSLVFQYFFQRNKFCLVYASLIYKKQL